MTEVNPHLRDPGTRTAGDHRRCESPFGVNPFEVAGAAKDPKGVLGAACPARDGEALEAVEHPKGGMALTGKTTVEHELVQYLAGSVQRREKSIT
jgi:hypothetical protein